MGPEKTFENKVKKFLNSLGIYEAGYPSHKMEKEQIGWFFKVWGGGYQKAGIPDIICCIMGMMVAVELKAENGRESEIQKINIERINKSGGYGLFLYPEGFERFKEFIYEMTKEDKVNEGYDM